MAMSPGSSLDETTYRGSADCPPVVRTYLNQEMKKQTIMVFLLQLTMT